MKLNPLLIGIVAVVILILASSALNETGAGIKTVTGKPVATQTAQGVVSHTAEQIEPGEFQSGKYTFPAEVEVKGALTSQGLDAGDGEIKTTGKITANSLEVEEEFTADHATYLDNLNHGSGNCKWGNMQAGTTETISCVEGYYIAGIRQKPQSVQDYGFGKGQISVIEKIGILCCPLNPTIPANSVPYITKK